MKKFVSLIAIVVAFYSYSSQANEIVGKGLVCHQKSFSNYYDKKPYDEKIYGFFFKTSDLVEIWINAREDYSNKYYEVQDKLLNELYHRMKKQGIPRNNIVNNNNYDILDFTMYEYIKNLKNFKFYKNKQLITYQLNDFHIMINYMELRIKNQPSHMLISRSSLLFDNFVSFYEFNRPLKKFDDKRQKCYPQADKQQFLKSLENYIPLNEKLHKNKLKSIKPKADAFLKRLTKAELEIKKKKKNKKF